MYNDVKELIAFIEQNKRQEKKNSLGSMTSLMNLFGNPGKDIKYVHVGGTNGKGSVVSYIKSVLMKAGLNVASFISPYVVCFNERISLNDRYISDEDVLKYGNKIIERVEKKGVPIPSFFDFLTLMAFLYFEDLHSNGLLDIAIIEVGLGGLFDSTNVISPLVSIISNVSYDHMNILGNTLEEIWKNKLGIMKKDTPFITYHTEYDSLIYEYANDISNVSNLYLISKNDIRDVNISCYDTMFSFERFDNIHLKLLASYQVENACLAIKALEILKDKYGYKMIDSKSIYDGLKDTFWPGRLEIIKKDPLIILDGAHNIDAVIRLKEFIEQIPWKKKIRLVIAISKNKEVEAMIDAVEGLADEVVYTDFDYKRSDSSLHLYSLSKISSKKHIEDKKELIDYISKDKDFVNILFGSLYFVSEIRNLLK